MDHDTASRAPCPASAFAIAVSAAARHFIDRFFPGDYKVIPNGVDVAGSSGDAFGVAFFAVGVLWLVATEAGLFRETTIARVLGVGVALVGAQVPAVDGSHAWLGYALTVAVAAVGIAVYLPKAAWPYLAGAVVAVTLVVPEAVSDWTDGSLGATGGSAQAAAPPSIAKPSEEGSASR